jgi:hypothetical protein
MSKGARVCSVSLLEQAAARLWSAEWNWRHSAEFVVWPGAEAVGFKCKLLIVASYMEHSV